MEKNRAFTLIELLVVIDVIAVLMGILMPSLRLAREQARLVSCASNQKQLLLGLTWYATENEDKLPPSPVKLIKIGAKVVRHSRYVIFQMAEVAVPRALFSEILNRIRQLRFLSIPSDLG